MRPHSGVTRTRKGYTAQSRERRTEDKLVKDLSIPDRQKLGLRSLSCENGSSFAGCHFEGEFIVEKVAIPPARVMRIIWFGFVLSGVMLIYVVVTIPDQVREPMGPIVEVLLMVVALVAVALGFFMPRILRRAAGRTREGQTGSAALTAWFRDNLIGLGWIYSCNVFAFILHFFRARVDLVEVLFGIGMISLLLWQPEAPPVVKTGKIARK